MPVRRRGLSSFALLPLLVVLTMLAIAAPSANAVTVSTSLDTVTGGETALFVTLQQVGDLARKGIYVSPISPAYLTFTLDEGPALRFPITGGAVDSDTMLGTVNHAGGMTIQKQNPDGSVATSLDITDVQILAGASLVGNALGVIPAPAADLVNGHQSKDPATGVITYEADAQVNAVNALVLNTYFNTDAFSAGMLLGHVKSKIQTKPLL
jgi:hypothetical protein